MLAKAIAARREDAATYVADGTGLADLKVVVLPVADRADGVRPQAPVEDAELVVVNLGSMPAATSMATASTSSRLVIGGVDPDLAARSAGLGRSSPAP